MICCASILNRLCRAGVVCALLLSAAPGFPRPQPANLVLDTDIGNDIDDALALGMLNVLQTRGACQLLAVTLTNPDPQAGAFVAAVNAFYGHGDIPIGVNPKAPRVRVSPYLKLAAACASDGEKVFPSNFAAAAAPAALTLLRRTLAAAADHSVVMVQIGFFTNLARLLGSPPDAISPLPGRELIARKVRLLSVMAGAFQTVNDASHYLEFNVRHDIPSAMRVAQSWPTPMVWSGIGVGLKVLFPARSVERGLAYAPRHPLREAYQLYRPMPYDRPTWDLTSSFYAVYPAGGYFTLSAPGRVTVMPDGFTRFSPATHGRDRYLMLNAAQAARLQGLLVALVTEPPKAN